MQVNENTEYCLSRYFPENYHIKCNEYIECLQNLYGNWVQSFSDDINGGTVVNLWVPGHYVYNAQYVINNIEHYLELDLKAS